MKNKLIHDVLLVVILFACSVLLIFFSFSGKEEGSNVLIMADGGAWGTFPLNEDRIVDVTEGFRVKIEAGSVSVVLSDCHGKNCIRQGKISHVNEMIACLPNRIVITIIGNGSYTGSDFYL